MVFVYATHATQAIAFEWKLGLIDLYTRVHVAVFSLSHWVNIATVTKRSGGLGLLSVVDTAAFDLLTKFINSYSKSVDSNYEDCDSNIRVYLLLNYKSGLFCIHFGYTWRNLRYLGQTYAIWTRYFLTMSEILDENVVFIDCLFTFNSTMKSSRHFRLLYTC